MSWPASEMPATYWTILVAHYSIVWRAKDAPIAHGRKASHAQIHTHHSGGSRATLCWYETTPYLLYLLSRWIGSLPYEHVKAYTEGVVLVSDDEIQHAMLSLFKMGIVAEPSVCIVLYRVTLCSVEFNNARFLLSVLNCCLAWNLSHALST